MTKLLYLTNSYQKTHDSTVITVTKTKNGYDIVLSETIFYPQGGGQPSDKGTITGQKGIARVKNVRMHNGEVIHECTIEGTINPKDSVHTEIEWNRRYINMRVHSAGHIVHEAVMQTNASLIPIKADHGLIPYIKYIGSIPISKQQEIENKANDIVDKKLSFTTEIVDIDELKKRSSFIPEHLPKNKPLRILTIDGFNPIPDGGTQVQFSDEVGYISIRSIENLDDGVKVFYTINAETITKEINNNNLSDLSVQSSQQFMGELMELQIEINNQIEHSSITNKEALTMQFLGSKSEFSQTVKKLKNIPKEDRARIGILINEIKESIEESIVKKFNAQSSKLKANSYEWFDVTVPGIKPPEGHLHIVTQAIMEITRIFEKIGFIRVRHPEVDWDWYAFESLHMPPNHPARDEWETFHVQIPNPKSQIPNKNKQQIRNSKCNNIVLTPQTSNGQVREMEKRKLPIRMINIAKCYRRQMDISHTPMFHQFEGLYVDKHVSIAHLKGVCDYFFKSFYGPERKSRLRPFHFQFTEPSFEIDVSCGICNGTCKLPTGEKCKLCKEGWLELGGAGMVHPEVLKNGGIDPEIYSGFAFGWGVERTYMMKSGTDLDDIRLIYSNDVRFLEQF